MKRWVVILLIALGVVVLLSPGLVGRLAEQNLSDSLGWMQQESDDIVVTSETYQRGWFTSEGRHRVALSDAGLAQVFGGPPPADSDRPPTLVIDTRIDHGLVPFTSLRRERGTLIPGIASSVSTMSLEYETGETVDLPGKIYSIVGLTGDTTYRYLVDDGSRTIDDDGTLSWQGADVTLTSDAGRRVMVFEGHIDPVSIEGDNERARIGRITFAGNHDKSAFKFGVGDIHLQVDGIEGSGPMLPQAGFQRLVVDGSTGLDGDRIGGTYSMRFDQLLSEPVGTMDLDMKISVAGLHASSLEAVLDAVDKAQAVAAEPAEIEPEIAALMAHGGRLTVERFSFRLPEGELRGSMNVEVPDGGDPDRFAWPSLMLTMKASMNVSIDAPLYDYLVTVQPEFAAATAMGFLSATGDTYEMEAAFASGLLTINGAPLPMPIAAPQ